MGGFRILLVIAPLLLAMPTRAQPRLPEPPGVTGIVLAPDGSPVSTGSVSLEARGSRVTTSIDQSGRFRVVPQIAGIHQLHVNVRGLAPYRIDVAVPPSTTMALPVIRLSPATYFQVRVASTGEPLTSARIRAQSFDWSGMVIPATVDQRAVSATAPDGTITVGPLPRGVTALGVDHPGYAQTRLPDLIVTGAGGIVGGGTVVLEPGAVLHVDVVDATGAPLAGHEVMIEDARPLSPLFFPPTMTDAAGRATFDRLSAGRYRVRTKASGPCGREPIRFARVISVPGRGIAQTRIVAGGTAAFRMASPSGRLSGVWIMASPDPGATPPPGWLRAPAGATPMPGLVGRGSAAATSCSGITDADGRLVLANFPPGPARVQMRLPNSTYSRQVSVPADGREIAVLVGEGFLPVRVTNARTRESVAGAEITWIGGGARVEARTSASGDALLEGIDGTEGTLTVSAPAYARTQSKLLELPAGVHEVALTPEVLSRAQALVMSPTGQPIANAVVSFTPEDPRAVPQAAVTTIKGLVAFADLPPGALDIVATADRFAAARRRVTAGSLNGIVLTLSRGHRVDLGVELPPGGTPYLVEVVNESGEAMQDLLDGAADRTVTSPARLSLGPLSPGKYIVRLRRGDEHHQVPVQIADTDVTVTLR